MGRIMAKSEVAARQDQEKKGGLMTMEGNPVRSENVRNLRGWARSACRCGINVVTLLTALVSDLLRLLDEIIYVPHFPMMPDRMTCPCMHALWFSGIPERHRVEHTSPLSNSKNMGCKYWRIHEPLCRSMQNKGKEETIGLP